ncbi:Acyl-CoA thioester hydrolase YbgC [Polystyrenella longa]|uniref:Acyl-CoA thioester hydrolase YbgC n=1 Tax=Polystyrenella longa TaxID=2528007 RepID=A0A518CP74_9PLAN|nr:thioesterase family protein [Polystyrenella longa]QDU81013.1 Acyl-CoA thioester hydrolase YbgC [Polystyrenella longa]
MSSGTIQEHQIEIRVRYSETDAMGFVHHGNYATYFEMGRTELLREQGGNYRQMEESGLLFVVAKLSTHYIVPLQYDDLLVLTTRVKKIGMAKLEHEYEIHRDGQLLTRAETVLACVDRNGKIQRIPENIAGSR